MQKLIQILVVVLAGFTVAFSTSAATSEAKASAVMTHASVGGSKDVAGMDALVQSLQTTGMVKTGFSTASRGRSGESSISSLATVNMANEAPVVDEGSDADGRMLVAGLVLMGVIAIRRIRS